MHSAWPETLQCNIVIERAPRASGDEGDGFRADVELDLGRRSPRVRSKALSGDVYAALRSAFSGLRDSMPTYTGDSGSEAA